MNVFKRMGDIISSNLNSALDKFEDPEKMIDLSISRLEESIAKMKVTIAEKSAEAKRLTTLVDERKTMRDRWQERAKLASDKNEDALAREAIEEKLRLDAIIKGDENSLASIVAVLASLNESKEKAEETLASMRVKSTELKLRAKSAKEKINVNKTTSNDENAKFEKRIAEIKAKIEKWETLADESSVPLKKEECKKTFEDMEREAAIEEELKKLKASV